MRSHLKIVLLKCFIFSFFISLLVVSCNEDYPDVDDPKKNKDTLDTDSIKTSSDFSINVKSTATHRGIKAFIFFNDSLYGITDQNGNFALKILPAGKYDFTCSARDYLDTSLQITKSVGIPVNLSFDLANDATTGRVYGEFQDMFVFRQKLLEIADLLSWDEKARYDGATGATMQKKNYTYALAARQVLINDESMATTDDFGQYAFKIQCGTYKITGTCSGYSSSSRIIKVLPDSKNYLNFYLERK